MITLITSVFKGDDFIKFYLENITKCNNYIKCEHLIFNIRKSNSENTINILNEYSHKYHNIRLINVNKDPGLYEIWNTGIKQAKYKYILSSNIDDIILDDYLNITYKYLENNPSINLVCSSVYVSNKKNTISKDKIWFYTKPVVNNNIKLLHNRKYDFYSKDKIKCLNKIRDKKKYILRKNKVEAYYNYYDKYDLITLKDNELYSHNLPHCCPVWRKALHNKFGYFNEKEYGTYADYEFWLRCMDDSTLFGFIPKPYIIYYINPTSHNIVNKNNHILENIYKKYYNINNLIINNIPKIIHQTYKKNHIDNIIINKDSTQPLLHTGPEKINEIVKTNKYLNNKKKFIFILCPPGHGSTLLVNLLSSSNKTSTFIDLPTWAGESQWLLKEQGEILYEENRWDPFYNMNMDSLYKVYNKYLDNTKHIYVDKSPSYICRAKKIEKYFKKYGDVFFIISIRCPYSVSISKDKNNWVNYARYQKYNYKILKKYYYYKLRRKYV